MDRQIEDIQTIFQMFDDTIASRMVLTELMESRYAARCKAAIASIGLANLSRKDISDELVNKFYRRLGVTQHLESISLERHRLYIPLVIQSPHRIPFAVNGFISSYCPTRSIATIFTCILGYRHCRRCAIVFKVIEQADRFSKETQNAKWFKPSLVTLALLAGLVPVIGVHMATMKFLPISLSPKSSFIVASTTLITISTLMAGLMYYLEKD